MANQALGFSGAFDALVLGVYLVAIRWGLYSLIILNFIEALCIGLLCLIVQTLFSSVLTETVQNGLLAVVVNVGCDRSFIFVLLWYI